MEILVISEYILIVSLIVFMLSAIRITTHRTIAMGLIGSATFSLSVAVLLVVVGEMQNLNFYKDIALALLVLGVIGTIAFAMALRRE